MERLSCELNEVLEMLLAVLNHQIKRKLDRPTHRVLCKTFSLKQPGFNKILSSTQWRDCLRKNLFYKTYNMLEKNPF